MNRRTRSTLACTVPLLLAALLLTANGRALASERLYAVELIVFSRDAASFEEVWPDDVALHYPPHARPLAPQGSAAAGSASEPAPPTSTVAESAPSGPSDAGAPATPPLLQSLERGTYALSGVAGTLSRRSDYRVLLHERWVQPAQVDGRAVPVAVGGGRLYGAHHELEGFVRLQVGRLLHVQANLWLSEFDSIASGPAESPASTFDDRILRQSTTTQPAGGIFLPRAPTLPEPVSTETLLDDEPATQESMASETWAPVAAEPLLPQQVIVVDERRRVKFGELHYFDHPRLGAIVQVTAIDPAPPVPAP